MRRLCEKNQGAIKALGLSVANALKDRLADLRAAETLHDLPPGVCGPFSQVEGMFSSLLDEGYCLVFELKVPEERAPGKPKIVQMAASIKILKVEKMP